MARKFFPTPIRLLGMVMLLLVGLGLSACGPSKTFGFQFYLTDSAGNPINGTKTVQIDLYNADTGGTSQYTEVHNNVNVVDGLANLEIGSVTPLDPALFAQPLWMEITVDGETLSPRQKMTGAPYALSLVGGAVVGSSHAGDGSDGTDANYGSLSVIASGSQGTALILGTSGDGDFLRACDNITSADRTCPTLTFQVQNDGTLFTNASTQIAVNPLKFVKTTSSAKYTLSLSANGYATFSPTSTGTSYAYLPVDLPSTLLGTPQKLQSIKVCYDLTNSASYISGTSAFYASTNLSRVSLAIDSTNRTSTAPTCYTITVSPTATINGPVFLRFTLYFGGTGASHNIQIGQVILTLTEQ